MAVRISEPNCGKLVTLSRLLRTSFVAGSDPQRTVMLARVGLSYKLRLFSRNHAGFGCYKVWYARLRWSPVLASRSTRPERARC
jgi:hypothetical protein